MAKKKEAVQSDTLKENFYFNKNIFLSSIVKQNEDYTEYDGVYKGVVTKFRLYKDNKIYIQAFCVKCGSEFYYEYSVKRPNLLCNNCKNVSNIVTPVEEITINGKTFVKYSNGMIRPK